MNGTYGIPVYDHAAGQWTLAWQDTNADSEPRKSPKPASKPRYELRCWRCGSSRFFVDQANKGAITCFHCLDAL